MLNINIFDGMLICTDLDGTLLRKDKTISKENLEAIEYFKANGGLFTFVTGRMHFYVTDIYKTVNPNVPFGCANGGAIFDHRKMEYVWITHIPNSVTELLEYVEEHMPEIGFLINTPQKMYFCRDNSAMVKFRKVTNLPNNTCDYKKFSEPISKIIFADENEENINRLVELLAAHPDSEKFDFVRSEHDLYEILPKGYNKGTIITKLSEILGVDMNKIIAIGDYDNDVSMIEAASIGIAVSNACEAAKAAADYITVSNEEHAIAKIISDLENGNLVFGLEKGTSKRSR